jgi:hypothetical protein
MFTARAQNGQVKERILAAAQASFLPEAERDILREQLLTELGIWKVEPAKGDRYEPRFLQVP